jgi:hypothetical protein
MEALAPPFAALVQFRFALEMGQSVRYAVARYATEGSEFAQLLSRIVGHFDRGSKLSEALADSQSLSAHRKAVIDLLWVALQGQPILERVNLLLEEVEAAANDEIETYIRVLPYKLLIPLFLFQVPAFLLLLLGPICIQLLKSLA